MAATEKLIVGATSTFTSLMTTELNLLVSGNSIVGSTTVDNSTNLDLFAEFSFTSGGSLTASGSPYITLSIYPLNGDTTTYGDGGFATSTIGQPPGNYYRGYCGLQVVTRTFTGTFSIPLSPGVFQIQLPRGVWKPVIYNGSGSTLSSSGNILYYRTTNLNLNA